MLGLCLGLLLLPTQTPKAGGPLLSSRVELGEIPPKVVYLQAETLSRGPVHEAYAAAGANLNFSGKHEVKTQPPAPLLEVPPGLPTSPSQIWIPGYWEHDAEENGWIWVTGCWREPPIGYGWLPGYWAQLRPDQWRRVSGLWCMGDGESFMLDYSPAPPQKSLASGSMPPKLDNRDPKSKGLFYSPAGWDWTGNRYNWRVGRLERLADNQVWQEQRQIWTPAGFIPSMGYVDHRINLRGIAYAPLRVVNKPKTLKLPKKPVEIPIVEVVEPAGVWNANAWIEASWRDRLGTYYFGDYYNPDWAKYGLVPARDARRRHGDAWLQSIEELADINDAAIRRITWQHSERSRGRQTPPPRVTKLDQPPAAGEIALVLPALRLDPSDLRKSELEKLALEVADQQKRLIQARQELEKQGQEGKRVSLKTPPPFKKADDSEETSPSKSVQPKK